MTSTTKYGKAYKPAEIGSGRLQLFIYLFTAYTVQQVRYPIPEEGYFRI